VDILADIIVRQDQAMHNIQQNMFPPQDHDNNSLDLENDPDYKDDMGQAKNPQLEEPLQLSKSKYARKLSSKNVH